MLYSLLDYIFFYHIPINSDISGTILIPDLTRCIKTILIFHGQFWYWKCLNVPRGCLRISCITWLDRVFRTRLTFEPPFTQRLKDIQPSALNVWHKKTKMMTNDYSIIYIVSQFQGYTTKTQMMTNGLAVIWWHIIIYKKNMHQFF